MTIIKQDEKEQEEQTLVLLKEQQSDCKKMKVVILELHTRDKGIIGNFKKIANGGN